jgi:hypothetical protein
MAWLLAVSIGMVIALALGNTIVLLAALIAALLSGLLLLRGQVPASASSQPAVTEAAGVPRAQRGVWTADGTLRQAQVLPVAAVAGYQTVLTLDGYALINAEGRIVYALNRESHAQTSEPVVVTIFDAEVSALDDEIDALIAGND